MKAAGAKGDIGEKGDKGDKGDKGEAGRGIASITAEAGNKLVITYTDGTTQTISIGMLTSNVLEYSLLPDGTYGVYAGSMASSKSIIEIPSVHDGIRVTRILSNGFKDLPILNEIIIPDTVMKIGQNAFSGCISLDNLNMPEGITEIDDYAFYGCTNLKTMRMPNSLVKIGRYSFSGCSDLTTVTIPASVCQIGKYAFHNTSLSAVVLENAFGWKILDKDSVYVGIADNKWSLTKDEVLATLNFSGSITHAYSNPKTISYHFGLGNNAKTADLLTKTVTADVGYTDAWSSDRYVGANLTCTFYKTDWIRE